MKGGSMNPKIIWIGLDVAKRDFVAALDFPVIEGIFDKLPVSNLSTKEFENSEAGSKKLLKWIDEKVQVFDSSYRQKCSYSEEAELPFQIELRVLMESTGIYSRNLEGYLLEQRPTVQPTIINASLTAAFRNSLNLKNKTDDLDAKAIARFGSERNPIPSSGSKKSYSQLCELCRLRDFYTVQETALGNMHESLQSPTLKRMNTTVRKSYTRKIEDLEREIKKFVQEHEELRREVEILDSMPGIGLINATMLLAELGSLKDYPTRNKLVAMAGMNPLNNFSGSSVRRSKLSKQGPPLVRKSLFLIAMHAVNKVPELRSFHDRLVASGKKPMTAQCACMRKILLILRTMVMEDRFFCEESPKKTKETA